LADGGSGGENVLHYAKGKGIGTVGFNVALDTLKGERELSGGICPGEKCPDPLSPNLVNAVKSTVLLKSIKLKTEAHIYKAC